MDYITTQMIPEFYEKSFKNQSKMTKIIMESAWESKIYDKHDDLQERLQDFAVPFDIVKNAMKSIQGCRSSLEEMYQFFNNNREANFRMQLSKLSGSTIVISNVNELRSISYDYIGNNFCSNLERDISKVLEGRTHFKDLYEEYCGPTAEFSFRGRFYSSDEPKGISLKRLCDYNATTSYPITASTISDPVVAMLIDLLDVKLAGKVKGSGRLGTSSFAYMVEQTETSFERLFSKLDNIQTAMKTAAELPSSPIAVKDCYTLFSGIYVMIYNIETRLVTMILRMMRSYIRNIKEISTLYDMMLIKDGLSSPAYDKTMLEDYEEKVNADGHNPALTTSSTIREAIDNTITSIINHKNYSDTDVWEINHKMTEENPQLMSVLGRNTMVDNTMYTKVLSGVDSFARKLDNFIEIITGSNSEEPVEWVDFDNALKLAGLEDVSDDRNIFRDIWTGIMPGNDELYTNPQSGVLLTDLQLMKRSITDVSARLHAMSLILKENYEKVDANPNGMYKADKVKLMEWFGRAFDDLSELDRVLLKSYRVRLIGIARSFLPYNDTTPSYHDDPVAIDRMELPRYLYGGKTGEDTEIIEPYDPMEDLEIIEKYEEDAMDEIEKMHQSYQEIYRRKLRGEVFFEGNEAQNNTGNTDTGAGAGSGGGGGEGAGNGGNAAPKPEIKDGGAGDAKNQQNNQQGDKNKDNKSGSNKFSEKLRALLAKIIELIKKIFERGDKLKNTKFLEANKGFLLSRSYTNTSVAILPYRKDAGPIKLLSDVISKATTIDPASLKTTNEDGIRNMLYGSSKIPKTNNGIEADLVQGFKVGMGKLENVTVADNELKNLVPSMIKYCENYYATITADLDKINNDIGALSKFDSLKNADDNDKTEDNVKTLNSMLMAGIRAARTASRDKCNNYMTVLSSLAASNKKAKDNAPAQDNGGGEGKNNNAGTGN